MSSNAGTKSAITLTPPTPPRPQYFTGTYFIDLENLTCKMTVEHKNDFKGVTKNQVGMATFKVRFRRLRKTEGLLAKEYDNCHRSLRKGIIFFTHLQQITHRYSSGVICIQTCRGED